jgi:hypothetical protein
MGFYADNADLHVFDNLIEIHKQNIDISYPGIIGDISLDKNKKDSIDVAFAPNCLDLEYGKHLQECLNLYNERYPFSVCNNYSMQEGFAIQYYPPNGGFKVWHTERESADMMNVTRHLVFMSYLNTVDDGGGTQFYHQNLTVKAEKGLTLIWPADWTFTHKGQVSPTQEKYIITGWLNLMKGKK